MKPEILDLRDDLRKGCAPFGKIMAAAANVKTGDSLLLLTPFEPVPLFSVMAQQGFTHSTTRTDSGDWEIQFTRNSTASVPGSASAVATSPCGCSQSAAAEVIELDTRGLQPPQPLVMILEAVSTLGETAELRARTNRRPMHLYPELESRGFSSQTEEQPDGSFITHIRRR